MAGEDARSVSTRTARDCLLQQFQMQVAHTVGTATGNEGSCPDERNLVPELSVGLEQSYELLLRIEVQPSNCVAQDVD